MLKSKKWLFGALVIGCAIVGLGLLNLSDNLVYFYTPSEAMAKVNELRGQSIRIGAMVKPGTMVKGQDPLDVEFVASDLSTTDIPVKYRGIPPDMFKEGQGVVAEGRFGEDGKVFMAKNLLVKHSEEYRAPHDKKDMNSEYLKRSLFDNQNKTPQ